MSLHDTALERFQEVWSRRKWLAVVVLAACLAGGATAVLSLPGLYVSTATVLVDRDRAGEAITPQTPNGELDARLQSLNEEILSRARLLSVIKKYDLYPATARTAPPNELVERMRRDIRFDVKRVEPSGSQGATFAFSIVYRGREPFTVSQVTNTLASFYVDEDVQRRARKTSETAEFLTAQVAQAKQKLDAEAQRIDDFNARHMGQLPQQIGANLSTLERLNSQLQANLDQQLRVKERRDFMARMSAVGSGGGSGSGAPIGETPESRLARLEADLAALRARYSEKYPDVVRMKGEVENLRREVESGGGPARRAPASSERDSGPREAKLPSYQKDPDLRLLQQEEARLRGSIASYQARVESTPQRDQELASLTRDYDAAKELYLSLLKKKEDAGLTDRLEQGKLLEGFRILDAAVPARRASAPDRMRLLLVVLAISISAAAGTVLIAERFDTTLHSADDVSALTIVPVLMSIPRMHARSDRRRAWHKASLVTAMTLAGLVAIAGAAWMAVHDNDAIVLLLGRGAS